MSEATPEERLDAGHYFELLDRVHIACNYLEMTLGEHPVLEEHPELKKLYDEAFCRLSEMYQAVGKFHETWE